MPENQGFLALRDGNSPRYTKKLENRSKALNSLEFTNEGGFSHSAREAAAGQRRREWRRRRLGLLRGLLLLRRLLLLLGLLLGQRGRAAMNKPLRLGSRRRCGDAAAIRGSALGTGGRRAGIGGFGLCP